MMSISTLLFDVGGVIIAPLDPSAVRARRERLAARLGYADSAEMWHRFYSGPEWKAAKTGRSTEALMWEALLAPHGLTPPQREAFVAELFAGEGVSPEMIALLDELHGRYPLGILSNASDLLEERLRHFGVDHYFDPIINSHRIGVAKPKTAAYETALARLGVPPEQVYFIDNMERNTLAAEALGFKCHIFRDVAALREALEQLALL